MAVLADSDREKVRKDFSDSSTEPVAITKPDIRAAVNAVDVWVDTNMAAYNAAIPQPARGALTSKDKSRLLILAIKRRWEVS